VGGRKPSVSRFDAREGGGARESPPSRQNTRRRVGGWQEAPPSHVSTRWRVCCYVQVSIVRHKSHARSMMSITRHDPAPDTVNQ